MLYVNEEGDVFTYEEFRNGHGFSQIWSVLVEKFQVPGRDIYDRWENLFKMYQNSQILSRHEQIVLHMSGDNVVVRRDDILTVAEALEQFDAQFGPMIRLDRRQIWHADLYAAAMRKAYEEGVQGIAFNPTSVSDGPLLEGVWEDDERVPYNVNTRTEHTFLDIEELVWAGKETT